MRTGSRDVAEVPRILGRERQLKPKPLLALLLVAPLFVSLGPDLTFARSEAAQT